MVEGIALSPLNVLAVFLTAFCRYQYDAVTVLSQQTFTERLQVLTKYSCYGDPFLKVVLKECMVGVTDQFVRPLLWSARQYVNGIVREHGKIQQKYTENCENPLYTEGFLMLYSRSCNVRTDAQIKSHVQRFRWMVPLRCEVGSGQKMICTEEFNQKGEQT